MYQTAHREHQFEIRDVRRGAANGTQTFGFPSDNIRLPRFARGELFLVDRTVDVESRLGDIAHSTFFACGDLEGRIHIWDLRNVREPLTQVSPKSPATLARGFLHVHRSSASRPGSTTSYGTSRIYWRLLLTTT